MESLTAIVGIVFIELVKHSPEVMPTLTADQMPKHSHGVGIYGGYWPDGVAVKNPCCKCEQFGQCKSPLIGNRSGRDCFIGRDGQQRHKARRKE